MDRDRRRALEQAGFEVTIADLVPDHRTSIENALIRLCDVARLVVTTGGTGVAERDLTAPNAFTVLSSGGLSADPPSFS